MQTAGFDSIKFSGQILASPHGPAAFLGQTSTKLRQVPESRHPGPTEGAGGPVAVSADPPTHRAHTRGTKDHSLPHFQLTRGKGPPPFYDRAEGIKRSIYKRQKKPIPIAAF